MHRTGPAVKFLSVERGLAPARPVIGISLFAMVASPIRTAIVASALLMSGCMPGMYTDRPEFRGTVIAAGARSPVSGASITVEESGTTGTIGKAVTDSRGEFVIPRTKKFAIVFLMQYPHVKWNYTIRAEAPGFRSTAVEVSDVGPLPPDRFQPVRIPLRNAQWR